MRIIFPVRGRDFFIEGSGLEMGDLIFGILILVFFLASYGFIQLCEKLRR
jgi:hypothetical protein